MITHYETVLWEMEIPCGIKGSFAVETLVGHEVGHVPEDVATHLALVDDVALALEHAPHLQGRDNCHGQGLIGLLLRYKSKELNVYLFGAIPKGLHHPHEPGD